MVAEFDEIEIAHRREQLLEIRRWVGSSRRQRRRQAALAAATAGALGLPSAEADALVSLARLDGLAGRNDDVETQLASAVERAREAGHVPTELRATYNLASDVYGRGDVRRALALCDKALARCAELGVTWSPYGLEIRALQVTALFVVGDWAGSVRAAQIVGRRPPDAMAARLSEQARLLRDTSLAEQAREVADRLLARAHETAERGVRGSELGPEGRAWLLRADAECTRVAAPGDVTAWERALKEFDYGHVYEQARCAAGLASALLIADQRPAAEQAARQSLSIAVELGAAPLRSSVEALARRARLDVGVALPSVTGGLPPRELEVLTQLAAGRTNRQIGERLFISDKTASVHVSNILAKLGARSRTEAVSLAHRAGLLSSS